jgi:hypothetical protein
VKWNIALRVGSLAQQSAPAAYVSSNVVSLCWPLLFLISLLYGRKEERRKTTDNDLSLLRLSLIKLCHETSTAILHRNIYTNSITVKWRISNKMTWKYVHLQNLSKIEKRACVGNGTEDSQSMHSVCRKSGWHLPCNTHENSFHDHHQSRLDT